MHWVYLARLLLEAQPSSSQNAGDLLLRPEERNKSIHTSMFAGSKTQVFGELCLASQQVIRSGRHLVKNSFGVAGALEFGYAEPR